MIRDSWQDSCFKCNHWKQSKKTEYERWNLWGWEKDVIHVYTLKHILKMNEHKLSKRFSAPPAAAALLFLEFTKFLRAITTLHVLWQYSLHCIITSIHSLTTHSQYKIKGVCLWEREREAQREKLKEKSEASSVCSFLQISCEREMLTEGLEKLYPSVCVCAHVCLWRVRTMWGSPLREQADRNC